MHIDVAVAQAIDLRPQVSKEIPKNPIPKWDSITDWYITDAPEAPVTVYCPDHGAFLAAGDLLNVAHEVRKTVTWTAGQSPSLEDWSLVYREVRYRVHKQSTVNGLMFMVRRAVKVQPELSLLGLPDAIQKYLLLREPYKDGGLVIICGGNGQGKSTTAAAVLHARVCEHGYFGLTVEDPVEFPLQGTYEAKNRLMGQIIQVPAKSSSFASDLRDALRCYPANSKGSMLLVGEVRSGAAAAELLRASVNGLLVITTIHAGDPIAAIERVLALAQSEMGPAEARNLLSHSLRVVIAQQLEARHLHVDALFSPDPNSGVGALIRADQIVQIGTIRNQQHIWMKRGNLLANLVEAHRRPSSQNMEISA
jgi:Tfp pilus assembly pilus retraction ATPase PilT